MRNQARWRAGQQEAPRDGASPTVLVRGAQVRNDIEQAETQLWELHCGMGRRVITRIHLEQERDPVLKALLAFLVGMWNSTATLWTLRCNASHPYGMDANAILRVLYDAGLQARHITHDPAKRQERAQDYLDYALVEWDQVRKWADSKDSPLARAVSNSPRWADAEPELEQRLSMVKGRFQSAKGDYRRTWYLGTLRDLAKEVGLEDEYAFLQRGLSGCVHSSSQKLSYGPLVRERNCLTFACALAWRVLGDAVEYAGEKQIHIALDEEESRIVRSSYSPFQCWDDGLRP